MEGTLILHVFKQVKDEQHGCSMQILTGCSVVTHGRKRKPVPGEYMKAMRTGLAESVVISSGGHGRLPHPTLYTDNRHHSNFKKKKFITFKF